MSYYRRHVFVCVNQRGDGRACCAGAGGDAARAYLKDRVKALGLNGRGGIRVNSAGCLDRCDDGPVMVVYPEGVWYTHVDRDDLDEIVERHLVQGEVVDRLRLDPDESAAE